MVIFLFFLFFQPINEAARKSAAEALQLCERGLRNFVAPAMPQQSTCTRCDAERLQTGPVTEEEGEERVVGVGEGGRRRRVGLVPDYNPNELRQMREQKKKQLQTTTSDHSTPSADLSLTPRTTETHVSSVPSTPALFTPTSADLSLAPRTPNTSINNPTDKPSITTTSSTTSIITTSPRVRTRDRNLFTDIISTKESGDSHDNALPVVEKNPVSVKTDRNLFQDVKPDNNISHTSPTLNNTPRFDDAAVPLNNKTTCQSPTYNNTSDNTTITADTQAFLFSEEAYEHQDIETSIAAASITPNPNPHWGSDTQILDAVEGVFISVPSSDTNQLSVEQMKSPTEFTYKVVSRTTPNHQAPPKLTPQKAPDDRMITAHTLTPPKLTHATQHEWIPDDVIHLSNTFNHSIIDHTTPCHQTPLDHTTVTITPQPIQNPIDHVNLAYNPFSNIDIDITTQCQTNLNHQTVVDPSPASDFIHTFTPISNQTPQPTHHTPHTFDPVLTSAALPATPKTSKRPRAKATQMNRAIVSSRQSSPLFNELCSLGQTDTSHTAQLQQIDTASATLPPTSVAKPPTNTQQPQVVKRQHTPQTDRAGEGKRKKTMEFGQVRAFNKNRTSLSLARSAQRLHTP